MAPRRSLIRSGVSSLAVAAVGMSANDMRPSYFAMLYLQQKGYRMIPVNPRYAGQKILGETVVASLAAAPFVKRLVGNID